MPSATLLGALRSFAGVGANSTDHLEKWVSGIGGLTGILGVLLVSEAYLGLSGGAALVASMGASAVLLFAVPHGPLSQPWAVFGGHLVSAAIGIACTRLDLDPILTAALAVALAISAMYYLRCIHPPGGATALAAVIGGEATHVLGYRFVLTPILQNVLVILLVAVIFNYFFRWRRYPEWLASRSEPPVHGAKSPIEHADLVSALAQIDSYIDVSEHDLLRIYELATGQADQRQLATDRIVLGHYYSNGAFGADWCVRLIVDESPHTDPDRDMVVFKVAAGQGLRTSGVISRTEFARWAKHELVRDDENWKRVP